MHTAALKSDGTVWVWGYNGSGQLGDGTIVNKNVPQAVNGLSGITMISSGWNHCHAVKTDGSIWGWGGNSGFMLGDGTTTDRRSPVLIDSVCTATVTGVLTKEEAGEGIHIYPNPSESVFNFSIEGGSGIEYKIYAIDGLLVRSGKSDANTFQVNLGDVPNGLYFVHFDNTNFIHRVMKLLKY